MVQEGAVRMSYVLSMRSEFGSSCRHSASNPGRETRKFWDPQNSRPYSRVHHVGHILYRYDVGILLIMRGVVVSVWGAVTDSHSPQVRWASRGDERDVPRHPVLASRLIVSPAPISQGRWSVVVVVYIDHDLTEGRLGRGG